MKIGVDVRSLINYPAGIGNYVRELLLGLNKVKAEDNFFLYSDREFEIDLPDIKYTKRIIKAPSIFWHFLVYFDALLISKVNIYFSTHSSLICLFPFLKTVLIVHDLSTIVVSETHQLKNQIFLGKTILNFALRNVQKIIVPSNFTKDEIIRVFHIDQRKIYTIYEGIKQLKSNEIIASPFDFPYFLFLGTIEPRKNLKRLIEAFSHCKRDKRIPHKLVIVGKKGWLTEEVYGAYEHADFKEDIIFTGYVPQEQLPSLYSHATAFIFPSLYEGFGLPPLEATSLGVLVVASNRSSLPEVLGSGAIFIDPYSIDSISEGIMRAITLSPARRKDIIAQAFANAVRFSWEKCARQTIAVLQSTLDKNNKELS